jgi:glycosyltransferase involved in cell wall biosynthesis
MLAPEFLPVWGGVGTYIVELVRHLPKDVEIHVVAPSREKLGKIEVKTADYDFDEYFSDNVHVHLISSASDTFVYNAAFQYACFKFVPKLIKETGIDLIHSHAAHMPDLLLQLRRVRPPTVATVHTTISGQRRGTKESGMSFRDLEFSEKATYLAYPVLRVAETIFFSPKKTYVTVSEWMKARLVEEFPTLRHHRIRVIQNAVDTGFFRPGHEDGAKVVLFTGRLVAAKGLIYLVNSIPAILRKHPDALFIFIGPGDTTVYESRLRELQVPSRNFLFLGYMKERNDLLDYYRKCAVFVAPTLYENLPIRVLEAMACAKPVVATNVCAIPEAITSQQNGILVPPRSVEALSEAISDLLGDPELRAHIGRRARQTVLERFDWTINSGKIVAVYEEALDTP